MRFARSILVAFALLALCAPSRSVADDLPPYLRDRGTGIRTSMFGSYVERGQFLIYPFYEYYKDDDLQYSPSEFGVTGDQDFEGRYRAHEGILFLAYGFTDRFMIEMEAAVISASFEKDPLDATGTPAKLEESGLGDVEGQLRYRLLFENEKRPEVFTYFEAVSPHDKTKYLIGTEDWELKLGAGLARGFGFGTLTVRAAGEYITASSTPWDFGEWAVEYLRRLNPDWRVYAGIEGQGVDEASFIGEIQRRLGRSATLKAGTGISLTPNGTDLAPEVGIMFAIPSGN